MCGDGSSCLCKQKLLTLSFEAPRFLCTTAQQGSPCPVLLVHLLTMCVRPPWCVFLCAVLAPRATLYSCTPASRLPKVCLCRGRQLHVTARSWPKTTSATWSTVWVRYTLNTSKLMAFSTKPCGCKVSGPAMCANARKGVVEEQDLRRIAAGWTAGCAQHGTAWRELQLVSAIVLCSRSEPASQGSHRSTSTQAVVSVAGAK